MPGTLAQIEAEAHAELAAQRASPLHRDNLAKALGVPEDVTYPGKRSVSDLFRDAIHANAPIPAILSAAAQLTPLGDAAAGAKMGANDLAGALALAAGQEGVAQDFARQGQRIEDDAAGISAINPISPEWGARMLRGASRSLTATAPGAVLGGAPGAIAMGMALGGASKFLERRELGEDERSSLYAALRQAGYEGLPAAIMQRLGLGGAETVLADAFRRGGSTALREIIKDGAKAGLHEIPEELVTTGAELGDTAATTDQRLTRKDILEALTDTAGQAFLAPNLMTPARIAQAAAQRETERTAPGAQALAAVHAEQERSLAHVPDGADPAATIKAGPPDLDTQQRDAMRIALAVAGRVTPPGLDPAHATPDDSPMAPTDPLLNFDPEQIGNLARADMTTPPTVELSQAQTDSAEPVSDPGATADTVAVSDASDFGRFLAERGISPEQHAGLSNQTADLAPFYPGDEGAVAVAPSMIAGQGIVAEVQMEPGAGIVAMTPSGLRTPVGRYINHSARPNARAKLTARGLEIVPIRAVPPGTELTIDYRQARGPAIELGKRITADPARQQVRPTVPTPTPNQHAPRTAIAASAPEDNVARHRKLTAELGRWHDREALARGEGKTGTQRAANAKRSVQGVQRLIDSLEGKMSPQELAQARPQAAPKAAPAPTQAPQPPQKAPPTPTVAPSPTAPRQIDGKRPSQASATQPATADQSATIPFVNARPAAAPAAMPDGPRAEVARPEIAATKLPRQDTNPPKSEAKAPKPAESEAGATTPANLPAVPDGSTAAPEAPGPQATPLGRLASAPTDPLTLTNLPPEARTQLLADARMLAQVAKSGSKTANKAKHIVKQLEKIAQAEADAQTKASQPAAASPPKPNPETEPNVRSNPTVLASATAEGDRGAVGTRSVDAGTLEGRGQADAEPAGRRDAGGDAPRRQPGPDPGATGRSAPGLPDGEGVRPPRDGRGDTRPSDDHNLLRLVRGEPVRIALKGSLSRLVAGHVEDRVPSFNMAGATAKTPHDAAVLFAALRSPFVERTSYILTDKNGSVLASGIYAVGNIDSVNIPLEKDLRKIAERAPGATKLWLCHNHPSGNPQASAADRAGYNTAADRCGRLGLEFAGVVTNGNRFSYGDGKSGDYAEMAFDQRQARPWEAVPFEALREGTGAMQVNDPESAAALAKLVQTDPGAVVVIAGSGAQVSGVTVLPAKAASYQAIMAVVARHGANQAIAVGPPGAAFAATIGAPAGMGRLIDVVEVEGDRVQSLRAQEPRRWSGNTRNLPNGTHAEPVQLTRAQLSDAGPGFPGDVLGDQDTVYRTRSEDAEPVLQAEQTGEETAIAAEPVKTDAEQDQADAAAMTGSAEPISDGTPGAPPTASSGALARMADALNAQPIGALGFLSPLVGTVKLANGAVHWWSAPLIERVENQAGEHGKAVATMARHANDRTRQLMGQASSILTPALRLMSGRSVAARAAVRNLRSVEWSEDGRYGFAKFQSLVEDANDLSHLAPAERTMVEKYRTLVDMTGQWAENAQFKVYTGADPNGTPTWMLLQRTPDGRKFIRRATQELHDIMQRPGSPEFEQMANALADANGIERPKVFQRLRDESEQAIILRQPLESTRWLARFPTHIRINGRIVPLLESDPFLAAQHIVRGTAMRVGYVEQFGQDIATAATPSEHPAVKAWVHAGGDPAAIVDLSRALNGMPVDQSPRLAPGTPEYDLTRTIKATLGIIRTGLLSKAAIVNVPESLGNTLAFVGGRRWLAAWAEMVTQPRVAATEMARMGARTEDVANLMGQEGRKRESLERIIREVGLRVTLFQGVNEVNELHAAIAGLHFAKDLAAGRTSGIDAERLRLLGFNDAEVVHLMSRTAPPALLEAVATRMAEATQGSTSLPSERAKAAHNRAWNLLVAFDSYGQMKLNRLARVHRAMLDAVHEKNPTKLLNAAKIAAGFYAGTAASGTAALFLAALAMGGASGLKQLWEQGEDHPADLAGDAVRYAMLGGAAASVVNAAGAAADGGDQFAEALTRMSLPVSLVQEVAELANGAGRYRDQDMDEKAVAFLRSHLPISRPIATLAAAIGVAYSDPGREAAMSAYWKWRREHTRMVSASGQDETVDEAHTRFRVAMRRAVIELRAGKDPSAHLAEALAAKSEQPQEKGKPKPLSSVVAAIKARRLLATLKDEERAAVTKEIGPTATAKLEAWDQALTEWAQRMTAPTN